MQLPFLNRRAELARLRQLFSGKAPGLAVIYGRRRLGKSRLIQRALAGRPAAYYVGDDRDASLQREGLAREVSGLVPGFAAVKYPDWLALFERYFREAPAGSVLAIDELPSLVRGSPELPSVLQKTLDARQKPQHVALSGSSQRMMHGLVLDASAPLFGRAHELLEVAPLEVGWLGEVFAPRSARAAVELWSTLGGVPRYWELGRALGTARRALSTLALDRLGALHSEPRRLLLDELDEVARASSILALVAGGAHRASEIAARIGVPATTLSRPLARLLDLGLLAREVPFGENPRDAKRSLYQVADPFLRTWYRFVEPNFSRLERGDLELVERYVDERWAHHLGAAWEELVRAAPGASWASGDRWWGSDGAGSVEIDLIARSLDEPRHVLVGEVKLSLRDREVDRAHDQLANKIARCPALKGLTVTPKLFVLEGTKKARADVVTGVRWWAAARRATRRAL